MTKFTEVQAGLNNDIRERKAGADAHRKRGRRLLARIPQEQHQMAYVLLAHADEQGMDDEAIIRACNIGGASLRRSGMPPAADPSQDTPSQNSSQQALYEAGANSAMFLLGHKPDANVPALTVQEPPSFKLDEREYKAGEDAAIQITRLLGRKVGE